MKAPGGTMTDREPTDQEALAQRMAALRSRQPARGPASPSTRPAPRAGQRAAPRRRRHVASGARRAAVGLGAAGTLGLVAGMALSSPHATATVPDPTPVLSGPAASTGDAPAVGGPSALLPGGQAQPRTRATPPPAAGSTSGSTHGSG